MIALGIDTHKHTHTVVALTHLGELVGEFQIETTSVGYRQFISCLSQFGDDEIKIGIEGAGAWGAGLCQALQADGYAVFEVERPTRKDRSRGKSDRIDALAAAQTVLSGRGLSTPRQGGMRRALACVLVAYRSEIQERTRLRNQIQSLAVTAPPCLRERIGHGTGAKLECRLAHLRSGARASSEERVVFDVLRSLAKRSRELGRAAQAHEKQMSALVAQLDPTLLDEYGVGPVCAAKLLVADPRRFRCESAFARSNGTAPLEASSGKTVRHRLSRRGDRQVNNAIHTIALIRSVHHPESRAYLERRISEGKTRKEAMRALKRQISRRLYKRICAGGLTL
jgi:hypothetical protein